ncbi:MAG TPA: family 20 glycosylhydrolase [Arachnia sp.]|nr:family 20 glycosylhydrolase [Arachnia sp.]HMT87332.1 family 20 glycosylhydrolase [Arachnia sp.]
MTSSLWPSGGHQVPLPAWPSLPSPSHWDNGQGRWSPPELRIEVATESLAPVARRLEASCTERGLRILPSADVSLRVVLDEQGDESYTIDVGDDVVIRAGSEGGAFRAAQSVAGGLRGGGDLPRGSFRWEASIGERGFHLDAARKFFPAGWIHDLLERMASLGLNAFQWHFSENEGVRLESLVFPEILSDDHITRDEAREILAHAEELHIAVVPSLDMPGHLRQVLSTRPELRLPQGRNGADTRHALDITKPEALDFAKRLIDDYAELFTASAHWNLGADEFVHFERIEDYPVLAEEAHRRFGPEATGFDLLTEFTNEIAAHLIDRGFTPRAWNDGLLRSRFVTLDPRIELAWWTNWHEGMRPVAEAFTTGHNVLNFNDLQWYYVLGENAGYHHPTAESAWAKDWHPGLFRGLPDGTRQEVRPPYPAQLSGAYLSVWSDRPETESLDDVARGLRLPLAAFAERAWNGGSALSFARFVQLAE